MGKKHSQPFNERVKYECGECGNFTHRKKTEPAPRICPDCKTPMVHDEPSPSV